MLAIDIIALDGAGPSSLGLTLDTLDTAARLARASAGPRIDWRVLAHRADRVRLRHGVSVDARSFASANPRALVIALGIGAAGPEEIERRLAQPDAIAAAVWLRRAYTGGAALAASCTGVFLLGEAGALCDRRCTTTWWLAGLLGRRVPSARLCTDAMVVEDSHVWTAGAMVAQLDLMLTLVDRFAGPELARMTGQRLAAGVRGSQAPFIDPSALGGATDEVVAAVESLVAVRLDRLLGVRDIARALGLSERTLSRRLHAAVGLGPARFVQKLRLDAAVRMIASSSTSLSDVAQRVGLADAASLHRLVLRHTGRTPGSFRVPTAPSRGR